MKILDPIIRQFWGAGEGGRGGGRRGNRERKKFQTGTESVKDATKSGRSITATSQKIGK